MMLQSKLIANKNSRKKALDKIARDFCLVFNRVTMYEMGHPYTVQAISDFYCTVTEGLKDSSPIVLIMNHEQFFIEDEPFDSRLNTSRMVGHFKKCSIESISFETGVEEKEIAEFFRVFCDQKHFPDADAMKTRISALGITNVKINYVFYKKMNSDEALILKEELSDKKIGENKNAREEMYKEVLNRITEGVVLDEFEKSISLNNLIQNPAKVSEQLIENDLSICRNNDGKYGSAGPVIEQQLIQLRKEVGKLEKGQGETNLEDLADAIFEMKARLLAGIEEQKALGVIYNNENEIRGEVDDISDRVILQLVKDEYKKGAISVQRLGHILRRLIPDPKEIQRLLPKLKEAMLAEGMTSSEFIELVKEIGSELQSDELSDLLKTSAQKIGLDSEVLIQELKLDPDGAAELIYLASEIRNGPGDEKVLTELLVDYIEKVGTNFADELQADHKEDSSNILRDVLLNLGSKLVNKLKSKELDNDVLLAAEKRLRDRIDKFLGRIENELITPEAATKADGELGKTTVFSLLEDSVEEGDELQKILVQVRKKIDDKSIGENSFQQIYDEIVKLKNEQKKRNANTKLPARVLNYVNTLLYLEKEIYRSLRYDTSFSTITFSILDLKPQKSVPQGLISGNDVNQSIMKELIGLLRGADIVGILNKKMIVVLLPMTNEKNAKIALQRIRKKFHASPIIVKGIPIFLRFAGAVTTCDHELTPDLPSYLSVAENNHNDLVIRLQNVNDLM